MSRKIVAWVNFAGLAVYAAVIVLAHQLLMFVTFVVVMATIIGLPAVVALYENKRK